MDTRLLESFIAVVDLGSMAEAARRLAVTPAAVAQRIHAFESEIGEQMLSRVGRTVQPTEAGSAIVERGRMLLRDMEELRNHATSGRLAGELRIGSISTALTGILPPAISRLLDAAPLLDLYIEPGTSGTLYQKVADGELDAAVVVKPAFALPKTCHWSLLRSERLIVIAPASMAKDEPHVLLQREPFIRYDRNEWGGRLADAYLRKCVIRPRERMELDALDSIVVMVNQGLGVSLVPDWAPPWPAGVSIAKLATPSDAPVREIGLVWKRSSPRLRTIEALRDALVVPAAPSRTNTRSPR